MKNYFILFVNEVIDHFEVMNENSFKKYKNNLLIITFPIKCRDNLKYLLYFKDLNIKTSNHSKCKNNTKKLNNKFNLKN